LTLRSNTRTVTRLEPGYMPENNNERKVNTERLSPVSYAYAHTKVRRARGSAHTLPCEDCGGQASQWAYQRGDEHEQSGWRLDERPKAGGVNRLYYWSPNVWAYSSLCVPCHLLRDRSADA